MFSQSLRAPHCCTTAAYAQALPLLHSHAPIASWPISRLKPRIAFWSAQAGAHADIPCGRLGTKAAEALPAALHMVSRDTMHPDAKSWSFPHLPQIHSHSEPELRCPVPQRRLSLTEILACDHTNGLACWRLQGDDSVHDWIGLPNSQARG